VLGPVFQFFQDKVFKFLYFGASGVWHRRGMRSNECSIVNPVIYFIFLSLSDFFLK